MSYSSGAPARGDDPVAVAYERLVAHLENAPLAIVEWDDRFRVRRWTSGAERRFGWRADEVVGRRPEDWTFVHPDDADDVRAIMDELLAGRAPRNVCRNRNLTRSGEVLTCDWYNSVVHDDEHRTTTILSLVDDVTERLDLERRVQEALRLESLAQWTGGVAHGINNVLAVVLGTADAIAARTEVGSPDRRQLDLIVEAARRGASLTHRLLSFAGRQVLAPRTIDVASQVRAMEPQLRAALGAGGALALKLPSGPRYVHVDPPALEEAISELVANAASASPRQASVVIRLRDLAPGDALPEGAVGAPSGRRDGFVGVVVHDDGPGIAAGVGHRVWEPFFTTLPADGRHPGLGLSSVLGFAQQSAGFVALASSANTGTDVALFFPSAEAPHDRVLADEPASGTVLVVEDDALVRDATVTLVEALGYRATQASNVDDAIALLETGEPIDVVFTDLALGVGPSGIDLAAYVHERWPRVHVVLTTGHHDELERAAALSAPFELLRKPYRRRELERALRARQGGTR